MAELYWWLQPVHSVPLLIASEIGLFGLLLVFIFVFAAIRKAAHNNRWYIALAIFAILATAVFDHYWWMLQQNLLLASIVFGLAFRKSLSKSFTAPSLH
jgi:hypothetical protein